MQHVRWRLAEFLKEHNLTAYRLAKTLESETRANTIYRLAREGGEPTRVDLSTLGVVLRGLRELTGEEITFDDILEYDPSPLQKGLDEESRTWLESDLSRLGEFEPYDWEEGEANEGESITFVPGRGLVVGNA